LFDDDSFDTHLTAIFQDNPGNQNISVLYFIGTKDDGDGGDNWSYKTANLQSNCHHQQTNTQLFTDRMPFLLPNQQCQVALRD